MAYARKIGALALALALACAPADAGQGKSGKGSADRDTQMDQDRISERQQMLDRDRDRIHRQDRTGLRDDEIYGHELMSTQERNQYRNKLQSLATEKARETYRLQHEENMRSRALKQGKDLVPPGQGPVYGGELMTVYERNRYREQLRRLDSEESRLQFEAQHRMKMDERAAALQREIEEAE